MVKLVLTGLPNYPKGEIYSKYKKIKSLNYENFKGIKIIRIPIIPRKKGKFHQIILNYMSYLISGLFFLRNLNLKNTFDHIFVYSTSPLTTALLGIYLKNMYKKKMSIWVQDLWPESVKNTGYIKNNFLIHLISIIVRYIYRNQIILLLNQNHLKRI